jgi:hypothetical protein
VSRPTRHVPIGLVKQEIPVFAVVLFPALGRQV